MKYNYPLVSILCPTYNAEKFIEKTLNSIISQDYENFEIIISDDASSDKTMEIVQRFSIIYPGKFKLNINPKNLGITKNCNLALSMCSGKFIAFFAGDDLMYPGKISQQVKAMEENLDSTLCYHSVDVLDGDNNNLLLFTTEQNKQSYFSVFDIISRGGLIGVCSVMVRGSAIPVDGFSNKFPIVSDWLMLIEVAFRGKIIKLKGVYGAYLRHSKGASRKTFETLGEIIETLDYLKDRYGHSKEIIAVANRALNRYLLGEIARLFIAGNVSRLNILISTHLRKNKKLILLSYILLGMIYCNAHRYFFIRRIYANVALSDK